MNLATRNALGMALMSLPFLIVAVWAPGPYARLLLVPGLLILAMGLATSAYYRRLGSKAERVFNDEREQYITNQSMRFTIGIMAVTTAGFWSYNFAVNGNAGFDYLFWSMAIFWASLLGSNVYVRLKQ